MTEATATSTHHLARARSFLFVPATRPERFAKALASGADAVIIDLEDAVAPADKDAARHALLLAMLSLNPAQRGRLLVRINAAATPWHAGDLACVREWVTQGLGAVMVPKAESVAGLADVARAAGPCALLPLIESVAGLDAATTLAACPQVLRLAFGHLDFQADAGLACAADESELVPVRLALVLASRRAALPAPVDGISPGTQDTVQLASDAARGRRGGFGGKLCIHPAQVAVVNAAFTPSATEIDWAQRVVAGFAAAGGGVFSLDGRMVDAPVMLLAQRTLAHRRDDNQAG
ncbi:CoA ester lyase [Polaromonas sp. CG_23.6]|uniref:HpcH/HpaI aldolase/citrate lyase family protein n=1 Tax=Polaromonas sp. CG_23.6 TaxID=2760709 RepID=UPI0024750DFD|nr:CoA ester lyase [Polaromonas sp. CG_23.6]MDH6184881.1 citrate lyase subunit beta/citryl-CoA lyase [Polaromonas sp. CG_23.6]